MEIPLAGLWLPCSCQEDVYSVARRWWDWNELKICCKSFVPWEAAIDALKWGIGSSANYKKMGLCCCFIWPCFVYHISCAVRNHTMEHVNTKFCSQLGKSPTETHKMLWTAYRDEDLSQAYFDGLSIFKRAEDVEDDPCSVTKNNLQLITGGWSVQFTWKKLPIDIQNDGK
jgi:hypothetical protein